MAELPKWNAVKVRDTFMEFFKQREHTFVQSSPVVPLRDPTLLFANAGMNQFKEIFLGLIDPDSDFGKLKRAVNSQMCIRAGGKHNDLEDVGRDTYHHTFFEMLGTWSFADYFKKEAIEWAWELLTVVYGLSPKRLYATYFEGSKEFNLPPDTETRDFWLKVLPADQVLPGNMKDNFWEMGDVGPCGPCTELHYDRIGGRNAAHLVNKDDPDVLEVWNLVFMQFHRKEAGGKLTPLPAPHVDTGMGLERIVSVLQDRRSNYDTDLWLPLFGAIRKATGAPKGYTELDEKVPAEKDALIAYRVVADHARCITMALSDGAIPDNNGRGFVLRRIIRRAIRYGKQFLGEPQVGFFASLVPAVVESLGGHFTHIGQEASMKRVTAIITDEEESFDRTWKIGLKHFETAKKAADDKKSAAIDPQDVFVLHDRYGFPADLTALLAEKEGKTVDIEAFQAVMKREQGGGGGRMAAAKTFFDTYQVDHMQKVVKCDTTDDSAKYAWAPTTATVKAIFRKDSGDFVETVKHGEENVGVVLDRTNFYAESGGQVYDTGVINGPDGALMAVERVHTFGGYVVHIGSVRVGTLSVGAAVGLDVNYDRRTPVAANHTATHQLNHALRDVLQFENKDSFVEVNQKGSFVGEDALRFDFSWNAKLTPKEIESVEKKMAAVIENNLKVYTQSVKLADALAINGIRCMFDEKYPDPCSVVAIGKDIKELLADPANESNKQYSVELCGGTHVKAMGELVRLCVISEEALTKGVRRLIVYTRDAAAKAISDGKKFHQQHDALAADTTLTCDEKKNRLGVLAKAFNDADIPLLKKVELRALNETAVKEVLAQAKKEAAALKDAGTALGAKWGADADGVKGPFAVQQTTAFGADNGAAMACVEAFQKARPADALFLFAVDPKKDNALAMAGVSKAMIDAGVTAPDWLKAACFGKGGGRPNLAQTGVPTDKVNEAAALAAKVAATDLAPKLKKGHADPAAA